VDRFSRNSGTAAAAVSSMFAHCYAPVTSGPFRGISLREEIKDRKCQAVSFVPTSADASSVITKTRENPDAYIFPGVAIQFFINLTSTIGRGMSGESDKPMTGR